MKLVITGYRSDEVILHKLKIDTTNFKDNMDYREWEIDISDEQLEGLNEYWGVFVWYPQE